MTVLTVTCVFLCVLAGLLAPRGWITCVVFTWASVPLRRAKPAPGESVGSDVTCSTFIMTSLSSGSFRCGCVTMLRSPNKTNAMKQWEQRWIKNCLCGGLWRRIPPTFT